MGGRRGVVSLFFLLVFSLVNELSWIDALNLSFKNDFFGGSRLPHVRAGTRTYLACLAWLVFLGQPVLVLSFDLAA